MRERLKKTLKTFYWITWAGAFLVALAMELFAGFFSELLGVWPSTAIYWLLFAWFLGGVATMGEDY